MAALLARMAEQMGKPVPAATEAKIRALSLNIAETTISTIKVSDGWPMETEYERSGQMQGGERVIRLTYSRID